MKEQKLTLGHKNQRKDLTHLWNQYYIIVLLVNFGANIAAMMLIAVLPLYAISIGGNNVVAGTLITVLTIAALIFRPISGKLIDALSRRFALLLGLGFFGIATLGLVFVYSLPLLFFMRFLQGIGLSAYSTALGTILSDVIPSKRLSEGIGYFGIAATLAMAISPSLGLYFVEKYSFTFSYIFAFGAILISTLLSMLFDYEKTKKALSAHAVIQKTTNDDEKAPEASEAPRGAKLSGSFFEKTSIRPCIVMFFIVISISSVFSFMPLYAKERGIENIGMFFTVYAVAMIISRLFTGKLADKYGYVVVLMPSLFLTMILYIILAYTTTLSGVLIAAIFYGAGYGTVQPILNTMVIRLSPVDRRGAANATYYAVMDFSFGLGSYLWGSISQNVNFKAVFLLCAVCVVASVVAYFTVLHPKIKVKA